METGLHFLKKKNIVHPSAANKKKITDYWDDWCTCVEDYKQVALCTFYNVIQLCHQRKDIYANSFGTLVVLYLITQLKK